MNFPQQDRPIVTPTGNGFSIRTERYALDPIWVSSEKGSLLTGGCIIEPDTDGTDDSNLSAVWRNTESRYRAFTDARDRTFGEIHLRVLLGGGVW